MKRVALVVVLSALITAETGYAQVRSKMGGGRRGTPILNRGTTPSVPISRTRAPINRKQVPIKTVDPWKGYRSTSPHISISGGTDNFSGRVHIGSSYPYGRFGYKYGYGRSYIGRGSGGLYYDYPYYYGSYAYGYPWWSDSYSTAPVIGSGLTVNGPYIVAPPGSNPSQIIEIREPTSLELAQMALQAGDADAAITNLRRHLDDNEETARVTRLLALAMFESGQMDRAVALMAHAYDSEPSLISEPIDRSEMAGSRMDMRERVRKAVRNANKVQSGSSWLLVCVLMQAEGRDTVAARMAQRAVDRGISQALAQELKLSLPMGG